jgi:hypothetical protein
MMFRGEYKGKVRTRVSSVIPKTIFVELKSLLYSRHKNKSDQKLYKKQGLYSLHTFQEARVMMMTMSREDTDVDDSFLRRISLRFYLTQAEDSRE